MPAAPERDASIPTRAVTAADQRAAALVCAANATGPGDLRLLLDVLGIAPAPIAPNTANRSNTAARRPEPKEVPMATSPSAYTAVALSMHGDGRGAEEIADVLGIPLGDVQRLLGADQAASTTPSVDLTALDAATPVTPVVANVTSDQVLNELLAWAATHQDKAIREHGATIRSGITALRERHQRDDELRAAQVQIDRLEEQLQALRGRVAELQPEQNTASRKKRERDYDPKVVRAWASANGVEVSPAGVVPGHVVDAWRRATTAPAAAGHGLAA
ncbi:histone-like nucleoid-structuring protein Lsr2 [Kitasatospora sp. NPDC089797]|uniref:Lsr2 family DNA-binding protein n=1 Tax=Kitasatospora sp. NPDC089797 TaxID=3155298 RepID=UPI00341417A9